MKLNAMLIDGDNAAMSSLERMLAHYNYLTMIGSYSNPNHALEFLDNNPVDVVFLDMDMPYISCAYEPAL